MGMFSFITDEQQLLLFEKKRAHTLRGNLERNLASGKIREKTFDEVPNRLEAKLELALIQSNIPYCRPENLIGVLNGNPSFIIPKYRVAIFLDNGGLLKIHKPNKNWKEFEFERHNLNDQLNTCLAYIRKCKERNELQSNQFTFVDLFAGIGGFRIPLEELGGKCLGFSEIDKNAIWTYKKNFRDFHGSTEIELGSVTNWGKLPFQHIDLIVGGVPCQSWSVAGKMKGFEDPRGQLWNDTIRVVELNQPKAFIFENVKGLFDPRNKGSLELIVNSFEKTGYAVKYKLLNSYDFGLPQNRERIYIVGIRKDIASAHNFKFPASKNKKSFLYEIIEDSQEDNIVHTKEKIDIKTLFGNKVPMSRNRFQKINELNDFFIFCDTRNGHSTIHSWDLIETTDREKEICLTILKNRRKQKYGNNDGNPLSLADLKLLMPTISKEELNILIGKKILKFIKGNGYVFVNSKNSSGINGLYRIYLPSSNIFSTLTATGTKDVVALKNVQAKTPEEFKRKFVKEIIEPKYYRPITSREAGKLQGFPDNFAHHPNEKLAKKQFGNAVSTKVVYGVGLALLAINVFSKAK